jgi:membrane protease YdiL (CAAX protease family)
MGAYLGGLWEASGNLLVPIVAHALYDFAVLRLLLRRARS